MSTGETIYDIPVVLENKKGCGETRGSSEDGKFPFDRRERAADDDQAFRHQLDDIAQRHPELAEHLQGFPRRAAGAAASTSPGENDEFFRRRFERPFGARFDRFGFPFDREDFEAPPQQSQPPPNPQYSQYPEQSSAVPNQPAPKVSQATQTETDCDTGVGQPPEVPVRGRPIQQSNTCDLTQKHEPDAESLNEREQRSMSAPPDNKQRFVSAMHIPMGNKGPAQNEQPHTGGTNSGSTERVIPIHVEGRDEPIIPRNFTAGSPAPQPERVFSDEPRAQPERIFGQRPEQFTQFVREPRFVNDGWHHPVFERRHGFPEEEFVERSASPSFAQKFHQPHQQQAAPHQQQQHNAEHQTSQQQEPPAAPQAKPQQTQPQGPIEQIQNIQKDVSELLKQVEQFAGAPKDKNYLYLDEMLTRNLLKLDNIDTQGQDAIRSARKEAIRCIEKAIGVLEAKAAANVPKHETVEKMEVSTEEANKSEEVSCQQDNKSGEEPSENMEVSDAQTENKQVNNSEVCAENQNTDQTSQQPAVEDKEGQRIDASAEAESKEEAGEKKEKKKIKKKKDEKEKN